MVTLENDKFEEFLIKLSKELDYGFDSGECKIFGINIDNDSYEAEEITSRGDIYEMLDSDDIDLLVKSSKYDYLTVGTCGWAAPIDNSNDEDNDLRGIQNENDDDFDYEQDNDENEFNNLGYNSN